MLFLFRSEIGLWGLTLPSKISPCQLQNVHWFNYLFHFLAHKRHKLDVWKRRISDILIRTPCIGLDCPDYCEFFPSDFPSQFSERRAGLRQTNLGQFFGHVTQHKTWIKSKNFALKKVAKTPKRKTIDKEIISTTLYHSAAQRQLSSLIYFRYVLIPFMIGHDSLHSSCSWGQRSCGSLKTA